MANSLLRLSPSTFTAPRPKFVRDPLIRPETKFLFDLTNPLCHPGGVITAGAAPAGTTFPDLVSGKSMVVTDPTNTRFTRNADGTISMLGNGSTSTFLKIGATGEWDMAPAPVEYIAILWVKLIASGTITTASLPLMNFGTPGSVTQLFMQLSSGGNIPQIGVANTSASYLSATGTAISHDVPHQIAMHFLPGSVLAIYVDGAFVANTTATPITSTLNSGAAFEYKVWNRQKLTLYSVQFDHIAASRAAEALNGTPGFAQLSAAQHIERDYLFRTGALTDDAPRTAFS